MNPSMLRSTKLPHSFKFSPPKSYTYFSSHSYLHTPSPFHPSWVDDPNNTLWGVELVKLIHYITKCDTEPEVWTAKAYLPPNIPYVFILTYSSNSLTRMHEYFHFILKQKLFSVRFTGIRYTSRNISKLLIHGDNTSSFITKFSIIRMVKISYTTVIHLLIELSALSSCQ